MQIKVAGRAQTYLPLVCAILTSTIVLALMNRDFPYVGHDYRYFILRLIDTKLFLLLNGPVIQWYTPSFGGGLPAYPNPQQVEYSVLQFFTVLMNPWLAVLVSTFLITCIGFIGLECFLEHVMGFHWTSSTLGAIFFIGNGFFIEHMIVGHIGHQLFPLASLVLGAAANDRQPLIKSGAIIALVVAMMIHQTGFYIVLLLCLTLSMVLALIHLYNPRIFLPGLAVSKLTVGLLLAGAIAGSKIYAVASLMQLFPRTVNEYYPVGALQAFLGLIAQLLGAMFFAPFLLLARQDISLLSGSLSNITGAYYGIWETDIGLSPVLVVLLFVGLAQSVTVIRRKGIPKINMPSRLLAWLLLLAGVWLSLEMTFARGALYPYIKTLPVLRSMHVNVRFSAAFILPLVLLGVIHYESLASTKPRQTFFLITAGLSMLFLFTYNLFPADVHSRTYDLTKTLQTDAAIQHGERFPIDHVAAVEEEDVFVKHATNVLYYEPLFSRYDRVKGYILKDFNAQVHPGPVTEMDHGYYNMTNPASLVFPKENNLQPFERIQVGEEEQLQAFVQRRQPMWRIPKEQVTLNWLSLVAFIVTLCLTLLPKRYLIIRRATNKSTLQHNKA